MEDEKYLSELSELIKKLNTDPGKGLSGREARARLSAERKRIKGTRSPFLSEKREERRSILGFLPSPAYLLAWTISLLSLIFMQSEVSAAVFACCLILAIGLCVLGAYSILLERKQRLYSVPIVRVLRGGRVAYTDAKNIVVGDIILFGEGDIIPGDARILMCEGLTVAEYTRADGKISAAIVGKRAVCDYGEGYLINTVYSGSPVMSGEGMAVVYATGGNVRASDVLSEVIPSRRLSELSAVKRTRDALRRVELVSSAAALLLAVIGVFTMRSTTSVGVIISALLPMLMLSPPVIATLCRTLMLLSLYRGKKQEYTIKSRRAIDLLPTVSDIIVFGRVGVTDGKKYIGREYLPASEVDEGARARLSEYLYTYLCALSSSEDGYFAEFSLDGYEEAVREYIRRYPCDTQRLDMTTRSLYFLNRSEDGEHLACADTNEGYIRICVSLDESCLKNCRYQSEGEFAVPLDIEGVGDELYFMKENALSPMFIMSDSGDGFVLEAILGFSEKVIDLTHVLECAETARKSIYAVLMHENEQTIGYLEKSGLCRTRPIALASEFRARKRSILDGVGDYSAYVGFSGEEIASLVSEIKAMGDGVLAYSVSEEYGEYVRMCDISASCELLEFEKSKYQNHVYEKLPSEGREASLRATSRMRAGSGLLVNRKNGLEEILEARRSAVSSHRNMTQYLFFCTLIFVILTGAVLSSVISGVEILSAGSALGIFTAFILGSVFMFSQNMPRFASLSSERGVTAPERLLLSRLPLLISLALAPFVCLAAVLIFKWTGFIPSLDGVDAICYLSLVFVGIFLAMRVSSGYCRKRFSDFLPRLLRASVPPLAMTVLFMAIPPIFSDIGFYKIKWQTLILLPIFVAVFLAAYGIGSLISEVRRK